MTLLKMIGRALTCAALVIAWEGIAAASVATPTAPTPTRQAVTTTMLGMPLQFEVNQGQVDAQVKFLARGSGYTLFLTPTESVLVLTGREASNVKREAESDPPDVIGHESQEYKHSVVRMQLKGANPSPTVSGMEQLPGVVNYFIGNDPAKWRTKIPTYAKVHYQEAYPGIDLAYYGNQGKLEYDFIVAPGADPNQIKLVFEGASDITVAERGDLLLTTALGDVRLQKPIVYQLGQDGHKTLVAGTYVVAAPPDHSLMTSRFLPARTVGIQLAAYDHSKPVVIDPVIAYSTYLGGSSAESGRGIAVDSAGSAYITGDTISANFPVLSASQGGLAGVTDAFVTKLDATGARVYSTYLGGSGSDLGYGIAVDGAGAAYVTGQTGSLNFPVLTASQGAFGGGSFDAFVTKLDATGSRVYSTYLGGSNTDEGRGIAVDGAGAAYVTGETQSANFPMLAASQGVFAGGADVFITKFNAVGARVYSTYLGGSSVDFGLGIAVDGTGASYVTGYTISTDFPVLSASQGALAGSIDAFVTKLDATGVRAYSTYLGGIHTDEGHGIAVDGAGAAYVTGRTESPNFPVLSASQGVLGGDLDAFITKFNAVGARVYSTYLGGSNNDEARGIAVDGAGAAYVTGRTNSTNFPVLSASQSVYGGVLDAFVTKLDTAGARIYSTYLGGSGADLGYGIAVDGAGAAYVTGQTGSLNFPVLSASQGAHAGSGDAFVTKLSGKPIANAGSDQTASEGALVTLDGIGSTAADPTYTWTQIAGPPVSLVDSGSAHPTFTAPHVPPAGDMLTFELHVCEGTSTTNCSDLDSVNVRVTNVNQPPMAQAGPDQTVQEGSPVTLDGTASFDPDFEPLTYTWFQVFGQPITLTNPLTATPSFMAPSVGAGGGQVDFELIVTDAHGLNHADYVSIFISNVNQPPLAHAGPDQTKNEQTLVTLDGSGSHDPDSDSLNYSWTQTGGPSVALTGANTVNPTFTAPSVAAGGAFLTFQLVVHDGHVSSSADTVRIAVVNVNDPPVCSLAQASPSLLWPPNHAMAQVSIMGLTDPQNQTLTITYPNVTQDEPINGLGDGDTTPDAAVSGNDILLRAERSGSGNGRVYVVHFTATNSDGAHCSGSVKVAVPHNKKDPAVEGSQLYNSFGP
ncbi:DUF7948 domain-containing protein [Candidatus Nitrospira nitrificans]|uniref:DUF7948 domain-containing protein n=1 Tax=Candidatus Nitrospira nitrificans TaxID=1742973 RepID=A0A0S4L0Y9_9BACT|nr:SBBP repeat-containing protein [Candidatus Nitrospira nitrificans]CUS31324.1 conserved exported hypothetical protein [Candidatus Nitrospira nitrificans]